MEKSKKNPHGKSRRIAVRFDFPPPALPGSGSRVPSSILLVLSRTVPAPHGEFDSQHHYTLGTKRVKPFFDILPGILGLLGRKPPTGFFLSFFQKIFQKRWIKIQKGDIYSSEPLQ
jgi:hypothetical protein